MNKKRILWCGESSHIPSGFGNFTREVLSRLFKLDKYHIAELSAYRTDKTPKTEPWKIYPVAVDSSNPLYRDYVSNPINQFGRWRFEYALIDFKPDIVIDVRDFWNFQYQSYSVLRPFFKWIICPTYDSSPPKSESFITYRNADLVLFHTWWAKNNLSYYDFNKSINIGTVLSDSVDTNVFKPIEYSKRHHKNKFGLPEDSFVIGSVMRNQKRKLIPDLFKVLRSVLDSTNKHVVLYLHTTFPEFDAWNIPSLLLEYNVAHNVYFTYKCRSCNHFWPNTYVGTTTQCRRCNNQANFLSLNNSVSADQLNQIYNLFDIYVQYAICEGFGIPQVEAASSGIPVITIDHGAMREVGYNVGASIVNVDRVWKENTTESDRVYPDNNHCKDILLEYINLDIRDLVDRSKTARKLLLQNYSWDKTTQQLEHILDSLDISSNISWDHPIRLPKDHNESINKETNRDFVYFVIDEIIKDPFLKKTVWIQEMIKNLDQKIIVNNNQISTYKLELAAKELEAYIKNKTIIEKLRVGQLNIPDAHRPFINY